ncbi:MAG: hypothetical protein Q8Q23_02570 [bacterium]|nr:hypothetical protein [bacterium]
MKKIMRLIAGYVRFRLHKVGFFQEWRYSTVTAGEWINQRCRCRPEFSNFQPALVKLLQESECILRGHFRTNPEKNLCSAFFLRVGKITRFYPNYLPIAKELVQALQRRNVEFDAFLSVDAGAAGTIAFGMEEEYKEGKPLFIALTDQYRRLTNDNNFYDVMESKRVVIVQDLLDKNNLCALADLALQKNHAIAAVIVMTKKKSEVMPNIAAIKDIPQIIMFEIDFPEDEVTSAKCKNCPDIIIPAWQMN